MFDSCLMAIQFAQSTKKNILAVSLDAEKAFYQVQREYLFDVLNSFGLGSGFIEGVKLLCRSTAAGALSDISP